MWSWLAIQAAASGEAPTSVAAGSQVTMGYNHARLLESCGHRKQAEASYKVGSSNAALPQPLNIFAPLPPLRAPAHCCPLLRFAGKLTCRQASSKQILQDLRVSICAMVGKQG